MSYPGEGVVVAKGEGLTSGRDACTQMEQVAARMRRIEKGFFTFRKKERKRRKLESVDEFT